MIDRWALTFTDPLRHTRITAIFSKALYVFVLIRLLLSWSTLTRLAGVYTLSAPRSVLAWTVLGLGEWAVHHITIFLAAYVALLLLALWLRPNYLTAAIIAWLYLTLYRIAYPTTNGADEVTTILLFLAIPLSAYPVLTRPAAAMVQRAAYHAAHLFVKLVVCAIYFVSGVDKLMSLSWRSGEAVVRATALTYSFNPAFSAWMPAGSAGMLVLAWMTILFELLFPVLVWFQATRPWILIAGVLFHLVIAAALTLPEFAAVMIVSYTAFLHRDTQGRPLSGSMI